MSESIFLNNKKYRFTTVATFYEGVHVGRKKPEPIQLCLIAIKHTERNREIVHPFSEFILEIKNNAFNSMKYRADTVVRFLNFILDKNDVYKLKSFSELNVWHGENYLTYVTQNGNSKSYFLREENHLTKFYNFLAKKELLDAKIQFVWEEMAIQGRKVTYLKSIFSNAKQPTSKGTKRPLHHIDEELLPDLLDLAARIVPRIALGIYFQCFGGLRPSEVASLSQTGITLFGPNGLNGMVLDVQTRYFDNKPRKKAAQSKRARKQNIEVFRTYLPDLYKTHLDKYLPTDGTLALFSNGKGRFISYGDYYYQFKKLMMTFIELLEKSGNTNYEIYALALKTAKAGPHIGRGIFSNLMAEILDARGLMLARGDKNEESAQAYKDNTKTSRRRTTRHLNDMLSDGMKRSKETV